jgi:hypothetical protein
MIRWVFLLEERSMQVLLDGLLPRLFPGLIFQCVPHEGKQDLEKSIPRKLRAWRTPGVRFVLLQDNDRGDCIALKKKLAGLCRNAGRKDVLVRIACQELEAWYLGEPQAMAEAFDKPRLNDIGNKARFRDPDAVRNPSAEVLRLAPEFQKISGARRMASQLSRERNRSASFRALMDGIERGLQERPMPPAAVSPSRPN